MADPAPAKTDDQPQREELRRLSAAVEEIRLLLRVLVVLAAVILVIVLIAGIVTASTAGRVQQQLGIN